MNLKTACYKVLDAFWGNLKSFHGEETNASEYCAATAIVGKMGAHPRVQSALNILASPGGGLCSKIVPLVLV